MYSIKLLTLNNLKVLLEVKDMKWGYTQKKIHENYTPEQHQFLIENRSKYTIKALTKEFNRVYNTNRTVTGIHTYCKAHNILSGADTRFKIGHTPHTKGKHPSEWISKEKYQNWLNTLYKTGSSPTNHKELFTERISEYDGYWWIKIGEPNQWIQKHRYIYEQHYNIKLKPKDRVIFLDGNKNNFDINNLQLVTEETVLFLNNKKLYSENPNITKIGILTHKLIKEAKKYENNN